MNGVIVVLSGPSGAGKGRTFDEILKRRNNVRKVLSLTSRPRRKDDKDNYIFVSKEEFLSKVDNNEFFEYVWYDDNLYGTLNIPTEELSERDLFFDKDVRGAIAIKQAYPEAITIYIMPKDEQTLLKRRGNRGKNREQIAKDEIALAKQLDFLVINDDINSTVEQIINCMRQTSMKSMASKKFLDEFFK